MIITNTATSTIFAVVDGKRLELKYGQSAIVPEKDGKILLKLFRGLKEEEVIESEPEPIKEPIVEDKPVEKKAKRNGKSKKSGK